MNAKPLTPNYLTSERQTGVPPGFIRKAEIIGTPDQPGIIPVSLTTWDDGVRSGRYPPGVLLSKRTVAWPRQVIFELCDLLAQGKTWNDHDDQQPSPNEYPSKQVDLVAQNLAASLRILLAMLATGPLNATTDTPTAIEMARAITLHALDGMNYVLQADDGKASESFNNSSQLSTLFNNGLKS